MRQQHDQPDERRAARRSPTCDQRLPLRLPSCQNTICSRAAVSPRNTKYAITPAAIALTAMPISTSVTTSVRPPERDSEYTSSVVSSAVTNAIAAVVNEPRNVHPKTITAHAPTAAPADTPITAGSASGLPKIALHHRAGGAERRRRRASPSTTRGKRTSHSTASPLTWLGMRPMSRPSLCITEPKTSLGGTCSWPLPAETSATTTSATTSPTDEDDGATRAHRCERRRAPRRPRARRRTTGARDGALDRRVGTPALTTRSPRPARPRS